MNAAFTALTKVYSGYIGMEHFAAAVRLLGYGGVALCLDEMLKIVKINVRERLLSGEEGRTGGDSGNSECQSVSPAARGA